MTREEATKRFETLLLHVDTDCVMGMETTEAINMAIKALKQPEIIRCKDCKYWNSGSCECREIAVNCQDYYVGDMETEAEHFCGYAERREVTE